MNASTDAYTRLRGRSQDFLPQAVWLMGEWGGGSVKWGVGCGNQAALGLLFFYIFEVVVNFYFKTLLGCGHFGAICFLNI